MKDLGKKIYDLVLEGHSVASASRKLKVDYLIASRAFDEYFENRKKERK